LAVAGALQVALHCRLCRLVAPIARRIEHPPPNPLSVVPASPAEWIAGFLVLLNFSKGLRGTPREDAVAIHCKVLEPIS
jgi:hypothetical protein